MSLKLTITNEEDEVYEVEGVPDDAYVKLKRWESEYDHDSRVTTTHPSELKVYSSDDKLIAAFRHVKQFVLGSLTIGPKSKKTWIDEAVKKTQANPDHLFRAR